VLRVIGASRFGFHPLLPMGQIPSQFTVTTIMFRHATTRFVHSGLAGAALIALCVAGGCASLSKNRVDKDVVAARQFSLRGVDAAQRGQLAEAESLFGNALELCPLDERIQYHYGETLWELGRHDEAVSHMERAVRLSGGNADLLVRLGDMYLARGDLQRAANQAELAVQANRQLASAWALRGDVLSQTGRYDDSLASYHRALSYKEHYPRVQLAIAQTYRHQGRHARALATLRSLADGYPVDEVPPDVLFLQGIALKELKRYEAAVETLGDATKQGEPSPDLLFHLAESQLLAGDPINAQVTIDAALAKTPQHRPSVALDQHLRSIQGRFATPDVDIRQR